MTMKLSSINPIAAALAVSLSTAALAESPIVPTPAKPAAEPSMAEGKCGGMSMQKTEKEGKCGAAKKEGMHEGKCGANQTKAGSKEGKCGGDKMKAATTEAAGKPDAGVAITKAKAVKEGKCGEGKCGAKRKKTTKETETGKPE
jgi:uncharacterized low-complexity protein